MKFLSFFGYFWLAESLPKGDFYAEQLKLYQNLTGITDQEVQRISNAPTLHVTPKFLVETNKVYKETDRQIYFDKIIFAENVAINSGIFFCQKPGYYYFGSSLMLLSDKGEEFFAISTHYIVFIDLYTI